jgi:hypothetical protein
LYRVTPGAYLIGMDTITTRGAEVPSGHVSAATGVATTARASTFRRKLAFAVAAVAAPIAVGGAARRLTRSRTIGWIAGGATLAAVAAVRWQLQRWINDEPAFTVEGRVGDLEIRRYAPRVEARTRIDDASFDRALETGFRRLAGYIFGGNAGGESLAMTGPVLAGGERLAMTGPVQARAGGSGHELAFVMPPGRTVASLPRPGDPHVELVEVPERRVAVLCYRGRYRGDRVEREARRIRELAAAALLATSGEPVFAGFDPPSTLPWLRRNELWLELA